MKWSNVALASVLESLESGSRPHGGASDLTSGIPSLGGEHIDQGGGFRFSSMKYIPPEHYKAMSTGRIRHLDILVVKDGATTGKTALVREDFPFNEAAVNENVFIVRINKSLADPTFVFYFLFSPRGQAEILKDHRGATIGGISRRFVDLTQIPLPPPSEQRRIVEILDQADALRKKRAEADAKAARILPALFYKMFGDPATNPKGWPVVPIGELIESVERRDPSLRPEETFIYIDIAGVNGHLGLITDAKTLMGAEAPSRARQIVRVNDVIISTVRPYLRATALVPAQYDNQICSTGFCVLRAKAETGFGFLYALSRLQWFTDQLSARARGASYPAVTDADIFSLRVPRQNDRDALKSFDRQVLDVLVLQDNRRGVAARIDNLFETLLHLAFTGDLTAKWREAHMKELLQEMEIQAKALEAPAADESIPEVLGKRHAGRRKSGPKRG